MKAPKGFSSSFKSAAVATTGRTLSWGKLRRNQFRRSLPPPSNGGKQRKARNTGTRSGMLFLRRLGNLPTGCATCYNAGNPRNAVAYRNALPGEPARADCFTAPPKGKSASPGEVRFREVRVLGFPQDESAVGFPPAERCFPRLVEGNSAPR